MDYHKEWNSSDKKYILYLKFLNEGYPHFKNRISQFKIKNIV